jgi:hypothetical protein
LAEAETVWRQRQNWRPFGIEAIGYRPKVHIKRFALANFAGCRSQSRRLSPDHVFLMRCDPVTKECGLTLCQRDLARANKLVHQVFELILCVGVPRTMQRLRPKVARISRIAADLKGYIVVFLVVPHFAVFVASRRVVKLVAFEPAREASWRPNCLRKSWDADRGIDVVLSHFGIDRAGREAAIGIDVRGYADLAQAKARLDWEVWNRLREVREPYAQLMVRRETWETGSR